MAVGGILLLSCLISACHENPLKTQKARASSHFLINASLAADKALNLGLAQRDALRVYPNCIYQKESSINCMTFYKAMAEVGNDVQFIPFKGIRVSDLQDKTVFDALREDYETRFFLQQLEY